MKNAPAVLKENLSALKATQPISLTYGRHQLTAVELKILATALFKMKPLQTYISRDGLELPVIPKKEEYATRFVRVDGSQIVCTIENSAVTVNKNYREVRKALIKLRERSVELKTTMSSGKKGMLFTGIIESSEYSSDGTEIELRFNVKLTPHLLKLASGFTKFGLAFVLSKTSSKYAIRWYQILSGFYKQEEVNSFKVSIDSIRDLLGVGEKSYSRKNDFFLYVFKKPIEEINSSEYSEFLVRYMTVRVRRSVKSIKISVVCKRLDEPKRIQDENQRELQFNI